MRSELGVSKFPTTLIYGPNRELIRVLNGATPVDSLRSYLKN